MGSGSGSGSGSGERDRLAALRAVRARDRVEVLALLHGVTGRVALLRALEEALATGRADARGRGVALLVGSELERHGRLQPADLVRVEVRVSLTLTLTPTLPLTLTVPLTLTLTLPLTLPLTLALTSSSTPAASSVKARVGEPRVALPGQACGWGSG